MITDFDKDKEFKKELMDKVSELGLECRKRRIPFFMTFCTANGKTFSTYHTDMLIPADIDIDLYDDSFRKLIMAKKGFDLAINQQDTFDIDDVPDVDPAGID